MPSIKQVQINILLVFLFLFSPLDKIFFFHLRFPTTFSLAWIRCAFSSLGAFSLKVLKKNFYVGRKEVITGIEQFIFVRWQSGVCCVVVRIINFKQEIKKGD